MFKVLNPFNKALTLSTGDVYSFDTVEEAVDYARRWEPYYGAFRVVHFVYPAKPSGYWFK